MKTRESITIAFLAATACIAPAKAVTTIYNPSFEFSMTPNPSSVWSYGYATTLGSPLIPFDQTATVGAGLERVLHNIGSNAPSITNNPTSSQINISTARYPAQTLVLHPGPNNEHSILRFTAPEDGSYTFSGYFVGSDVNSTTSNVAILENAVVFFGGSINGYGATSPFNAVKTLNMGDTIDFAVGFGGNGGYLFDSTALHMEVVGETIPEPSASLLGGLGSALLLLRRRRK